MLLIHVDDVMFVGETELVPVPTKNLCGVGGRFEGDAGELISFVGWQRDLPEPGETRRVLYHQGVGFNHVMPDNRQPTEAWEAHWVSQGRIGPIRRLGNE